MKPKLCLAALVTLLSITGFQAEALDKGKLDQFFDRLEEKNKAMGSLVVAKNGHVVYDRTIGFGEMKGTQKIALSKESRFRIGSITKMFTAVMTLQLVDEGKLKLTDTLDQFFPEIPNAQKITIAHLLSHRSGLPSSRPESKTNAVTREQLLDIIASGKPEFEPDSKHAYSNSGYFVLGLIIEKLTGKSYDEALKERIASKIGLRNTYSSAGDIDPGKQESYAFSHFGGNWKQQTETHASILFGGGQIVSTSYDMATIIHALFGGKLISNQTLKLMSTIKDGEGLGMTSFKFAGKTFYGETGGGDNRGAWLAYEPEEKLAIAYSTNAKIYPVTNIVSGVVDIYYDKPFNIPALESLALDPELLDKYVGNYSTPGAPAPASITRDGATLYFQPPGAAGSAPLEAIAENKFQIEGAAVFTFDPAKNQMTIKRRGGERVFTKVR